MADRRTAGAAPRVTVGKQGAPTGGGAELAGALPVTPARGPRRTSYPGVLRTERRREPEVEPCVDGGDGAAVRRGVGGNLERVTGDRLRHDDRGEVRGWRDLDDRVARSSARHTPGAGRAGGRRGVSHGRCGKRGNAQHAIDGCRSWPASGITPVADGLGVSWLNGLHVSVGSPGVGHTLIHNESRRASWELDGLPTRGWQHCRLEVSCAFSCRSGGPRSGL